MHAPYSSIEARSVGMCAHVKLRYRDSVALWVFIPRSKLPILWPSQIWSISQKQNREMTISKATFAPSTPCTTYFECLESCPNDSTRVRRLTSILRRARVKIFILAYGGFWFAEYMNPGCIEKSNTNNSPAPTDLNQNPKGKKNLSLTMQLKIGSRGTIQNSILDSTTRAEFWKMFSSSRKRGGADQNLAYSE